MTKALTPIIHRNLGFVTKINCQVLSWINNNSYYFLTYKVHIFFTSSTIINHIKMFVHFFKMLYPSLSTTTTNQSSAPWHNKAAYLSPCLKAKQRVTSSAYTKANLTPLNKINQTLTGVRIGSDGLCAGRNVFCHYIWTLVWSLLLHWPWPLH